MSDAPIVIMPMRDDWEACGLLLAKLDEAMGEAGIDELGVIIIDDSSLTEPPAGFPGRFTSIAWVDRLRLRRNMGHQRSICIALCHLVEEDFPGPVVVMDADGEDDPADVPRLLEAWERREPEGVVFAERLRRSESPLFKLGYWCYRQLHLALTGYRVRVGNFSVLGAGARDALAVLPALWSHYSAAVFVSGVPYSTIPADRAPRLAGKSSMNVLALTVHGLAAISVFSDVVGVRLFMLSLSVGALAATGIGAVLIVQLVSGLPLGGWTTYATGILLLLLGQVVMTAIGMSLLSLRGRHSLEAIPLRDHSLFIKRLERLYGQGAARRAGSVG